MTREPAGNLESGLAAALTGSARIAIVSGGLACLAAAALVTAALPMLWRYDARTYVPEAGDGARAAARRPQLTAAIAPWRRTRTEIGRTPGSRPGTIGRP